jgi:hypothetical protein
MVLSNTAEDAPQERDDLIYADDYFDVTGIPPSSYVKKGLRIRRLICRVCKLKFRTRQETQEHIIREHRRIQGRE